jgi:hypothetical protein
VIANSVEDGFHSRFVQFSVKTKSLWTGKVTSSSDGRRTVEITDPRRRCSSMETLPFVGRHCGIGRGCGIHRRARTEKGGERRLGRPSACQAGPGGHVGGLSSDGGLYSPKWTSTAYTMLAQTSVTTSSLLISRAVSSHGWGVINPWFLTAFFGNPSGITPTEHSVCLTGPVLEMDSFSQVRLPSRHDRSRVST